MSRSQLTSDFTVKEVAVSEEPKGIAAAYDLRPLSKFSEACRVGHRRAADQAAGLAPAWISPPVPCPSLAVVIPAKPSSSRCGAAPPMRWSQERASEIITRATAQLLPFEWAMTPQRYSEIQAADPGLPSAGALGSALRARGLSWHALFGSAIATRRAQLGRPIADIPVTPSRKRWFCVAQIVETLEWIDAKCGPLAALDESHFSRLGGEHPLPCFDAFARMCRAEGTTARAVLDSFNQRQSGARSEPQHGNSRRHDPASQTGDR